LLFLFVATSKTTRTLEDIFLTAARFPKKDFYTPPTYPHPKNVQQTFVLHTQNSVTFVLRTQKSPPKSRPKKGGKKAAIKAAKKWQERRQKSWQKNTPKKHTVIYKTYMLIIRKKLLKAYSEPVFLLS
jgi:hypothetical protein